MRQSKKISPSTKKTFAFVVDGECEFWYLNMLKRNERLLTINLSPEIPQKKKIADQYQKVIDKSHDYDKVFWVVDFDTIIRETRETKKGEKSALQEFKEYFDKIEANNDYKNIHVIINNPCFEYWLLLHFETTSKYYDNCEKLVSHLKKKYIPDYKKSREFYTKQNNDIYLRLKPQLNKAIENANKLSTFDFKDPACGMTQMQLFSMK